MRHRAYALLLLGAAAVLAGAGCGLVAGASCPVAQQAGPVPGSVEVARLVLPPPGADDRVLSVSVRPLRRPLPQGLSVLVQLHTGGQPADRLDLGRLALYPSDSPGTFLFRVPVSAVTALARCAEGGLLVLLAVRGEGLQEGPATPLLAVQAQWLREPR